MGQLKGHTGNPNGRPRGKPNKITQDLRSFIEDILNSNKARVKRSLRNVDDMDFLKIYERLASYVVPKRQEIDIGMEIEHLLHNIDNLDEPQLMRLKEIIKEVTDENRRVKE